MPKLVDQATRNEILKEVNAFKEAFHKDLRKNILTASYRVKAASLFDELFEKFHTALGRAQPLLTFLPASRPLLGARSLPALEQSLLELDMLNDMIKNLNETGSRARFNLIFATCLHSINFPSHNRDDRDSSPSDVDIGFGDALASQARSILPGWETLLKWDTVIEGAERTISRKADYSVWYEREEEDSMALNLVIVEAKRQGMAQRGKAQCAGYMGCVHTRRIDAGKQDTTVYGFSTDGL
ncbi:hypothetical protein BJY00DRAFT_316896 [Aspergillus carlsbadensis]|nr:hypothetical protein BJY00DRAFT_316896 [Aspergillus carlsbadensis]